MSAPLPQRTRVYRCHHLDSTRWDDVVPRPDDIVITTSLKAGTTWTQRIVSLLVFQTIRLPNTLLVHYNDLKADLEGEMRRIARFLEIEVPEEKWPTLSEAATFAAMKRDAELLGPEMNMIFEGGADRFLYKGTNDRWRDVLTSDDVALYEDAAARTLTPDLKRWLERGAASGIDPKW